MKGDGIEILKVKKFPFKTYDVYLEIIGKKDKKYYYRVYSQNHPTRNGSIKPYNHIQSNGFDEPWLAVIHGYDKVELTPRANKK